MAWHTVGTVQHLEGAVTSPRSAQLHRDILLSTRKVIATAQLSIVAHTWNPQEAEAGSQEFRASLGYIAELEVGLHELLSPKQRAKQIHTKQ